MAAGEAVVLDVRPRDEYNSGHVPGAVSAPLEELEHHLDMLSRDKEILTYCRGRYCVLSHQAVRTLTQNGYRRFGFIPARPTRCNRRASDPWGTSFADRARRLILH
ncbi:MAG: hypothetical protein GVY14_03440 [Spirochaetes bacterium]|nr:hypothetical protein [Spirochaetota bacterium]